MVPGEQCSQENLLGKIPTSIQTTKKSHRWNSKESLKNTKESAETKSRMRPEKTSNTGIPKKTFFIIGITTIQKLYTLLKW